MAVSSLPIVSPASKNPNETESSNLRASLTRKTNVKSARNRWIKTTPKESKSSRLSLLGPGSAIGFSLVDPKSSVERLTYAAESKVRILVLPKDIFKQEISGLQGSNMKMRHRGTINALKQQFSNRFKFYPGRTEEAVRTRNVVNYVSDVGEQRIEEAKRATFDAESWFIELATEEASHKLHLTEELAINGKTKMDPFKDGNKRKMWQKK